jgi:hypothetical protein
MTQPGFKAFKDTAEPNENARRALTAAGLGHTSEGCPFVVELRF